jgi:hypothetical protein
MHQFEISNFFHFTAGPRSTRSLRGGHSQRVTLCVLLVTLLFSAVSKFQTDTLPNDADLKKALDFAGESFKDYREPRGLFFKISF